MLYAPIGRIASIHHSIDGTDRYSCDPAGRVSPLAQSLIGTSLICSQRPTALQDEHDFLFGGGHNRNVDTCATGGSRLKCRRQRYCIIAMCPLQTSAALVDYHAFNARTRQKLLMPLPTSPPPLSNLAFAFQTSANQLRGMSATEQSGVAAAHHHRDDAVTNSAPLKHRCGSPRLSP